ncbi:MAG: hypothetical protein ACRECP_12710 [Methylocella sp.]
MSSNASQVRQLMANLVTDPALTTLAQGLLQNNSSSLTNFQQSLIQAFLLSTPNSAALAAILTGQKRTDSQKHATERLKDELLKNPAVRRLKSAGHALKNPKKSDLLQLYVNQAVASDTVALHTPTTLGDPNLDAVVTDIFNLQSSAAYQGVISALTPLTQSPDFLRFLRKQPSLVLVSFMPVDVVLALRLPVDHDPFTPATVEAILELIAALAALIVAVYTVLEELAIALAIILLIGLEAALTLAFLHLFKSIDCDFDGDPSDPNDVPGNECP